MQYERKSNLIGFIDSPQSYKFKRRNRYKEYESSRFEASILKKNAYDYQPDNRYVPPETYNTIRCRGNFNTLDHSSHNYTPQSDETKFNETYVVMTQLKLLLPCFWILSRLVWDKKKKFAAHHTELPIHVFNRELQRSSNNSPGYWMWMYFLLE